MALSINPLLTAFEVETIMRRSASDLGAAGYDIVFGWGMVVALIVVALILSFIPWSSKSAANDPVLDAPNKKEVSK